MFGSNNAFGNTNSGSTFGFGNNHNNNNNTNSNGGLFGNNSNNNTNNGGGLNFGVNNNTSNHSGGLNFGNNVNKPASTGFGFGNNKATTSGGMNFGSTNNNNSGGMFGNTANKPSTGFSFGNKPASTGLFGNNTNNTNNNSSTIPIKISGTGNNTNNSSGLSFGFNNNNTNQNQAPRNNFSNQPAFSWSKPSQPTQQTQQLSMQAQIPQVGQQKNGYTPTISDQLVKVKNSWDSNSPQCIMKTYFYNKVPQEFNSYQRPNDESPEEWEKAMKERPKNYNSIPVKAKGFEDLLRRSNLQIEYIKQSRLILNQINDNLVKLGDKHDLDSTSILLKCETKQRQLDIKLLKIAINLSILKYKGYPLTNDEERLIARFKQLLNKIDDPVGLGRVNEIWARLSNLKQRLSNLDIDSKPTMRTNEDLTQNNSKLSKSSDPLTNKNETVITKLAKVLSKEQQGIQYLYEMIEGDNEAIAKYEKEL